MKAFLKNTAFLTSILTFICKVYCECEFPNHKQPAADLKGYQKLKSLVGKRFKVDDPTEEYTYHVGICTDAIAGENENAGIVQVHKVKGKASTSHIIGKYTSTGIMAGTNWVYLEYGDGDNYKTHCDKQKRKAVILFTCDPYATDETALRMLEEQTELTSNCYYLFELAHPQVCGSASSGSFLSIGSIIIIVFFCLTCVYLIAGGLYQRFILGAKGIEQIPNYEFWKDFGNLQADGCDFVCRTTDTRSSSPYKGLGDDQLEEPEGRDDNLLPM
ncbi:hypothetical protein ACOMHN_012641 [Nucella lapillus]